MSFRPALAVVLTLAVTAAACSTNGQEVDAQQTTPQSVETNGAIQEVLCFVDEVLPQLTLEQIAANRAAWYSALHDRADIEDETITLDPWIEDCFSVSFEAPIPLVITEDRSVNRDDPYLHIQTERTYALEKGPFGPTIVQPVSIETETGKTVEIPITFQFSLFEWSISHEIPLTEWAGLRLHHLSKTYPHAWTFVLEVGGRAGRPADRARSLVYDFERGDVPQILNVMWLEDLPELLLWIADYQWYLAAAEVHAALLETFPDPEFQRIRERYRKGGTTVLTGSEKERFYEVNGATWETAKAATTADLGPRPKQLADVSREDLLAIAEQLVFVILVCPEAINGTTINACG